MLEHPLLEYLSYNTSDSGLLDWACYRESGHCTEKQLWPVSSKQLAEMRQVLSALVSLSVPCAFRPERAARRLTLWSSLRQAGEAGLTAEP